MFVFFGTFLWFFLICNVVGYFFGSAGISRLAKEKGLGQRSGAYLPMYRLYLLGKLTGKETYLQWVFPLSGGILAVIALLYLISALLLVTILLAPVAIVLFVLTTIAVPLLLYICPLGFYILLHRLYTVHCGTKGALYTALAVVFAPIGMWQYLLYFLPQSNESGVKPE